MGSGLRTFHLNDFSGGLNIRDAASELAANELSDAYNVTLDERGGVAGRLGYMKWNPTPYNVAAKVQNTYYWEGARKLITQVGASMYEDQSVGAFYANTTSARVAMTEFAGLLLWVHPVDGVVAWNGATYQVIAGSPPASTIAVWQNKVWVSGAGDTRVRWSAPGDHTSWPAGNFVDLREKDTAAVVCLGLPGGTDIVGRSGLLAFK